MAVQIAFLRGISVSGRRMIPMRELQRVVEDAGFAGARIFLQTGNVLLPGDMPAADARRTLEAAITAAFGHDVPVAVRPAAAVRAAVEACPFDTPEGVVVYAALWVEPPDPERLATLATGLPATDDALAVGDGHVYVQYRGGVHTSPLSNGLLERRLRVALTSRNLNTLRRLAELAGV